MPVLGRVGERAGKQRRFFALAATWEGVAALGREIDRRAGSRAIREPSPRRAPRVSGPLAGLALTNSGSLAMLAAMRRASECRQVIRVVQGR